MGQNTLHQMGGGRDSPTAGERKRPRRFDAAIAELLWLLVSV